MRANVPVWARQGPSDGRPNCARLRPTQQSLRDAEVVEAIDAVLFVGMADWYPPNYDCDACGYATCAEFLHATKALRDESAELEFAGPTCNLRDIDLGIAVGSAAKTAAIHLTAGARPAVRSRRASSASSKPTSPSPCHSR